MKSDSTAKPAVIGVNAAPKPSIPWAVAAILGRLLALLIVADVIGVAMCFVGDIVHPRGWSAGAVYAVWFVLGVFVGLIHQFANDECDSPTNAMFAITLGVTVVALLALTGLFHHMMWSRGIGSPDGYAPDSKSATLTFFITIVVAMVFFRGVATPKAGMGSRRVSKAKR